MKQTLLTILMVTGGLPAKAAEPDLDKYLASFDYAARRAMKIDSEGLTGPAENLRGDAAHDFIQQLPK